MEHLCVGGCAGNTPESGCYQSATCAACPAPAGGTATCTASGACDFTCGPNTMKSGTKCVCTLACCSDADCQNGTGCLNNQCTACDPTTCIMFCLNQGKIGACNGVDCQCI
jgi:hypothetical protein